MPAIDALNTELDDELHLLRSAAREAGKIALGYFGRPSDVWMKEGDSPVSEADLAVDRFLKDALMSARPDYGWLSEETVDDKSRLRARRSFVVDPIDGTRAFIANKPVWCVSAAIVEDGRTLAGVLVCPVLDEEFVATIGGGATLNGASLKIRGGNDVPLIAGPKALLDRAPARLRQNIYPRYVPSLAYRVAMVANGALDATFIKSNSHDWDIAAADLILHEAGGAILQSDGCRPRYAGPNPQRGSLVAGSEPILGDMVEVIAGHRQ